MPGPFFSRCNLWSALRISVLVVLAASILVPPVGVQADQAVDLASHEVEMLSGTPELLPAELTVPVVEPEPEPIEIPPTPTEPVPLPTEVPPTEEVVVTAEPTVGVPTPPPTLVATPSPTIAATPSPTPAPAKRIAASTPATTQNLTVMSIVAGSGCTQISTTDTVPAGTAVGFACNGADGPGESPVTRTFSGLTSGWQYQVNQGSWLSSVGPVYERADLIPDFTVSIRPTTSVAPGTSGQVTVSVSTSNGSGGAHVTTIGATRQPDLVPTAADLQLTCSPASVSAPVGSTQTISCTYSAKSSLGSRQITLSQVKVPAPAGWTITSPVGTVAGSTLTITPNTIISYSATAPHSYSFSYTITPGCTASTTAQTTNLTSIFSSGTTNNIVGAAFAQRSARTTTSNLAISISNNSLNWNQAYSLTDTTVSGNLTYQIAASGCSGWNVQIVASPFQYTGPNNGAPISSSNLQLTAAGNPVVINGAASGVAPQSTTGAMNTPIKVMSANSGAGIGTYAQQLDFNMTIPGKSRTGTYQSTITVTSTAAP